METGIIAILSAITGAGIYHFATKKNYQEEDEKNITEDAEEESDKISLEDQFINMMNYGRGKKDE